MMKYPSHVTCTLPKTLRKATLGYWLPLAIALWASHGSCGAELAEPTEPDAQDSYTWDVSVNRTWLPGQTESLSDDERDALQTLTESYTPYEARPSGGGIEPAQAAALVRQIRERMGISRGTATGSVTGRAIRFTGEGGPPQPRTTTL